MITDKIKALFQFIEFLHSNIENFRQYDEVINEQNFLIEKRNSLKPGNNFNDKLKYDEIQEVIKDKFIVIKENIINLLQAKATELNICDWNKDGSLWNNNISEISNLKENFNEDELPEIVEHKRKYIEFRTTTNCNYFQESFFSGLDEILKILFDYFKETEENEFEAFEAKKIEVKSFTEFAEIISGKSKLKIEIDKNLSITEKLNFWQKIIEINISEPLKQKFGDYFIFNTEAEQEQRKILTKLFGLKYNLVSPLLIPEHIYNEHFANGLKEPEFTFWFLKYNAQTYFENEIIMKHFSEKLKTPLSENFINAELKKLNDFEIRAESLLHESKFDIYNEASNIEYSKEIEYLRIKAEYYKTHALPSVHAIGNTTVVLFAEHIFLKNLLESELIKVTQQNRLQLIKEAVVTNKWANGSLSQMRYNYAEIWHQVAGYHWEGDTLYKNHSDIVLDTVNFPIVTKGFTAFLIQLLGNPEQVIFDKYYEKCLNRYKQIESRKPGSSMRNLDAEFYPLHVMLEKEFVTFSEKIHPYLSKTDIELINQYTEAYFNYIDQVHSPSGSNKENSTKNQKENKLSIPDWCIIFYYIDEAGTKEGNKIDRMEKFIVENNVLSSSGTLTTKGFFKKEYHEIENRINGKKDKNPLPPERIENILTYLKNSTKALKAAKSDIEHLTNEIEENKKNTY